MSSNQVRLELTEAQRNAIREATGKDATVIEFSVEELEERIGPSLGVDELEQRIAPAGGTGPSPNFL